MKPMALVGSQTYRLTERQLRGQHHGQPVIEFHTDSLTQGVIEVRQRIRLPHALPPRRVSDQHASREIPMCGPADQGEVFATDTHDVFETKTADIVLTSPHSLHVAVVAPDLQLMRWRRRSALVCIRANSAPLVLVMTRPAVESETLPIQSRSTVQRHQGALQKKRGRTTHRIE